MSWKLQSKFAQGSAALFQIATCVTVLVIPFALPCFIKISYSVFGGFSLILHTELRVKLFPTRVHVHVYTPGFVPGLLSCLCG